VAVFAYSWVTNPAPRAERAQEENVVRVSRSLLASIVVSDALEIVDPLAPNRKVGKAYVYAEPPGWAVSGYYRRGDQDRWHPYLITLTAELKLHRLKVQDPGLSEQATSHPELEIID
jgi:hypothetical protein